MIRRKIDHQIRAVFPRIVSGWCSILSATNCGSIGTGSRCGLILCQITSRAHWDSFTVPLDNTDCERGEIGQPCFIRPQRLFTVEQHVILRTVSKVTAAKYDEVFKKTRALFID